MEITVRKATLADAPAIRLLEKEIIVHERKLTDSLKPDEELYYYEIPALINDEENSILIVLEHEGKLVGCGFGQIRENSQYYLYERYGYIGMMSVSEAYRGQGLSGKVIEALMDFFRRKDIKEVKLFVFPNNDGAIRSYEKAGFTGHLLEMRTIL